MKNLMVRNNVYRFTLKEQVFNKSLTKILFQRRNSQCRWRQCSHFKELLTNHIWKL